VQDGCQTHNTPAKFKGTTQAHYLMLVWPPAIREKSWSDESELPYNKN